MKLRHSFLFMMAIIPACSSDSNDDSATPIAALALEIPVTTGTALNVGLAAMDSVTPTAMGLQLQVPNTLNLEDSESESETETVSTRDSNCSDYGNPFKDGVRLEAGEDGFAERAMYCTAAFNAGSPDSVLGAISTAGVIMCELERAGAWSSDADFTTAGNNVGSKTISLSTNCTEEWFIERLSEGTSEFPLQNVTLYQLDASHGYDKRITYELEDEAGDFYIRTTDDFIAAKTDNWAFSIDTVNSIVRYETLGESTDSENETTYVRRIRLKIEGQLNTSGAFESFTSVQGLKLEGRGVDSTWSEFVTISGAPDTGLATSLYYQNGLTNDQMVSDETGCTSTDCSAATRITATEAQIDTFHTQAQVDFLSHEQQAGIIAFDDVDLSANVTYDAKR